MSTDSKPYLDNESEKQSPSATLSDEERKLYEEHQKFITAHFETFAEVGERLADIRDRKLYREEFKTFEEFCRTRWKITRRRANQLIQGAEVIQQLLAKTGTVVPENHSETGTIVPQTALPTTERQTRELAKAPADQRQAIMREATQDGTVKPTARAIKLAAAKRELEKGTFLRDSINQIRRHCGDKLADAILLQEIDISTEQIYTLAKQAPVDLAALVPRILEAKRFPLTPSGSDTPIQTRKDVLGRYLTKIAEICSERFVRKLKDGEILPEADDVKLFSELNPHEMGELEPFVLETRTFKEARYRQAGEQVKKLKTKLQNKLQSLFYRDIRRWIKDQDAIARCKDALYKAVDEATCDELREFAGFDPTTEADINLEEIDPQKIKEAIMVCHEHNKGNASNQEAEISFRDILAARANSTPSFPSSRIRQGQGTIKQGWAQGAKTAHRDSPK
jgi:hypothetical protein